MRKLTLAERFFSKYDRGDSCWEWRGRRDVDGYGRIGGNSEGAHRASWAIHVGPIPAGLFVLHACDNPPCVRPGHLFLGTQTDNIRDRHEKRRSRAPRGEANGTASLNAKLVADIRERTAQGQSDLSIARDLGIGRSAVYHVRVGRNWSHVKTVASPSPRTAVAPAL